MIDKTTDSNVVYFTRMHWIIFFWPSLALGGALGGPLGNAIGRYVGPYRYPIIGRSVNAPGISNAPGNTVGSVVEGVSVGVGELGGQQF